MFSFLFWPRECINIFFYPIVLFCYCLYDLWRRDVHCLSNINLTTLQIEISTWRHAFPTSNISKIYSTLHFSMFFFYIFLFLLLCVFYWFFWYPVFLWTSLLLLLTGVIHLHHAFWHNIFFNEIYSLSLAFSSVTLRKLQTSFSTLNRPFPHFYLTSMNFFSAFIAVFFFFFFFLIQTLIFPPYIFFRVILHLNLSSFFFCFCFHSFFLFLFWNVLFWKIFFILILYNSFQLVDFLSTFFVARLLWSPTIH